MYDGVPFLWEHLKENGKKVLLYGTGNGADMVLDLCGEYGIECVGVFASDGFCKGKTFRGFNVMGMSEALNEFPDAVVLLCFAVFKDSDIDNMVKLSKSREFYAPDVPVISGGTVTRETLNSRKNDIEKVKQMLADDESRECFDCIMKFKISGDINYLLSSESDREETLRNLFKLDNKSAYADLGAYRGDTVDEYIKIFGEPSGVYAFEPAEVSFKKLSEHCADRENITLINAAASDECGKMSFSSRSGRGAHEGGKYTVTCATLDSVAKTKIGYIKLDVEGAEIKALKGSINTIEKYAPYLSVSAYHNTFDIIDIAIFISTLPHGYKLYLRHHRYIPSWDVIYYAVPNCRAKKL